jgi:hypothetical protein
MILHHVSRVAHIFKYHNIHTITLTQSHPVSVTIQNPAQTRYSSPTPHNSSYTHHIARPTIPHTPINTSHQDNHESNNSVNLVLNHYNNANAIATQCNATTLNAKTKSTCRRMRVKNIYNLSLRKHTIQQCKQQV